MVTIYNTPLSTTSEKALFGRPGGGIYTNNPPDSDFTRNGVHVCGAVPLSFGLADGCTWPCS